MPEAVWRLLGSMAAEESRGHRAVLFEGRIQWLEAAVAELRAEVARGSRPARRRVSSWRRRWPTWLIALAFLAWWAAMWLMDEGYDIGLTDDQATVLVISGFVVTALWWLSTAGRRRFGTRR